MPAPLRAASRCTMQYRQQSMVRTLSMLRSLSFTPSRVSICFSSRWPQFSTKVPTLPRLAINTRLPALFLFVIGYPSTQAALAFSSGLPVTFSVASKVTMPAVSALVLKAFTLALKSHCAPIPAGNTMEQARSSLPLAIASSMAFWPSSAKSKLPEMLTSPPSAKVGKNCLKSSAVSSAVLSAVSHLMLGLPILVRCATALPPIVSFVPFATLIAIFMLLSQVPRHRGVKSKKCLGLTGPRRRLHAFQFPSGSPRGSPRFPPPYCCPDSACRLHGRRSRWQSRIPGWQGSRRFSGGSCRWRCAPASLPAFAAGRWPWRSAKHHIPACRSSGCAPCAAQDCPAVCRSLRGPRPWRPPTRPAPGPARRWRPPAGCPPSVRAAHCRSRQRRSCPSQRSGFQPTRRHLQLAVLQLRFRHDLLGLGHSGAHLAYLQAVRSRFSLCCAAGLLHALLKVLQRGVVCRQQVQFQPAGPVTRAAVQILQFGVIMLAENGKGGRRVLRRRQLVHPPGQSVHLLQGVLQNFLDHSLLLQFAAHQLQPLVAFALVDDVQYLKFACPQQHTGVVLYAGAPPQDHAVVNGASGGLRLPKLTPAQRQHACVCGSVVLPHGCAVRVAQVAARRALQGNSVAQVSRLHGYTSHAIRFRL
nr:MAG TPA: hypothetical protein [Caudoviricetes sp.]